MDGTRMSEIPARGIEGRAQALWATPTELQTSTPPKQRKRRGLSFPPHREETRTREVEWYSLVDCSGLPLLL